MSIERQPEAPRLMPEGQGPSNAELLAELLRERQRSDQGLRELIRQVLAEYVRDLQQSSCAMGRTASNAVTIEMKQYSPDVNAAYAIVEPAFKTACDAYPVAPKGKPS